MLEIGMLLRRMAVLIGTVSLCQFSQATDLLSIYHKAVTYDAQYAAAGAARKAGAQKTPQALAGLLPTLSLSASSTWTNQDTTFRISQADTITNRYNDKGWAAQLTQPLFRWQNWANYKQAELIALSGEIQFGKAKQDLMLRAASAYFDVLLAKESLVTSRAQLTAIGEQLEAAKRGFALGTATIADSYEAQARFDLQSAYDISANNDLAVKENALRSLCGEDFIELRRLKSDVSWNRPIPDKESDWTTSAASNNFDVQLAGTALEIATREIEKRRANYLPTLDMVGTYEDETYSATLSSGLPRADSEVRASSIVLQVRMPIFSGGLTNAQVKESIALREKALNDLNDLQRKAILESQQSYQNVISGLAQIKAYESAMSSSEAALKASKRGYELGIRVNLDVLNAQSQLFDTRQKLLKSRFDTLIAQLKLKASAGVLQEADLAQVNLLLE